MIEKSEIVLVGPYRPPVGGVATHVERLSKACLSKGYKCCVLDIFADKKADAPVWVQRLGGCSWIRGVKAFLWLSKCNASTIHFHVASMDRFHIAGWPMLLATLGAQTRIITIHGGTFVQKCRRKGRLFCAYIGALLRCFDAVIAVNEEQVGFLVRALQVDESKVHMIPAYIPASAPDVNTIFPKAIREMMQGRRIVLGSGQATRTYGHDILMRAVEKQGIRDDLLLIIALYSTRDTEYLDMLEKARTGMHNCIFVYDLPPEVFASLLTEADVYVRPTYVDGDSVTVREALAQGCCVIASDCIDRPEGVNTFKSGCHESLSDCLQKALRFQTGCGTNMKQQRNFSHDVMLLYKRLIGSG
ncbi:MAG: glycosyltransferase family 4 protein [Firmicutes bacterium]|nr:glycosyltransferase family 4 protein [Bacillota bacterium]